LRILVALLRNLVRKELVSERLFLFFVYMYFLFYLLFIFIQAAAQPVAHGVRVLIRCLRAPGEASSQIRSARVLAARVSNIGQRTQFYPGTPSQKCPLFRGVV
jgi:hypothetical protein